MKNIYMTPDMEIKVIVTEALLQASIPREEEKELIDPGDAAGKGRGWVEIGGSSWE